MEKYSFIKDRLKELGKRSFELADYMGLAPTRISDYIMGRREPLLKEVKQLSDFLGLDFLTFYQYVIGESNTFKYSDGTTNTNIALNTISTIGIKVLGYVEAGVYKESEAFEIDEQETLNITPSGYDPKYLFGLIVNGNSMNKKFAPGTRLICVSIEDCPAIENGKYVIAQRNRGGLYETTVKRFEIRKDGSKWLIPESTDAKFQPIEIKGSEGEEIRILAIVIGCYQSL